MLFQVRRKEEGILYVAAPTPETPYWLKHFYLHLDKICLGNLEKEVCSIPKDQGIHRITQAYNTLREMGIYPPKSEFYSDGICIIAAIPHAILLQETYSTLESDALRETARDFLGLAHLHTDFYYNPNFGHVDGKLYYTDLQVFPLR
ncbi:MAG: hypothetical protein HGA85_05125 [Nanoarchaeota archaeon]|nr:hypothetical protein [Nanoarchaeota archaeon]